jgi:Zn-finger nucleic acid-binding protein
MQDQVKAGMPCPVCKVDLVMSDRQGVEIDYCPKCRGVWLDRGELDKIIERNASYQPHAGARDDREPPRPAYGRRGRYDDDDDDDRRGRGGFLSDLFNLD